MFERLRELFKAEETLKNRQQELEAVEQKLQTAQSDFEKMSSQIQEKQNRIASLDEQISKREETVNEIKAEAQKEREQILADCTAEQEKIIESFNDRRTSAEEAAATAEAEAQRSEKRARTEKNQLYTLQTVVKAIKLSISRFGTSENPKLLDVDDDIKDMIDELQPTIDYPRKANDYKDLRALMNANQKQVDELFARYEKRYTTKTNKAIYQLMTLALRAEFQNVLAVLKNDRLEVSLESLKSMQDKFLKIASDGNQSIAPTLFNFVSEVSSLFEDAVKIEYEYYVRKEKERAEQQALRDQMRQEAEERKILAQQQKQVEKEESKYQTEIEKVKEQMSTCQDDARIKAFEEKILELQRQLEEVAQKKDEIISRQNGKAGYVYVISNLGSFGENTFKVGMTRRLDPMERVKELGDASVPFSFDVHSFIFSEDAVSLETELHHRLDSRRKNKINLRKEFFDISIDELEALVQEINPAAEFNRTMLASEYRQSQSLS